MAESVHEAGGEPSTRPPPGHCRITIHNGDSRSYFDVRRNDLLLLSAIDQQIDYPHNCRVGTCGRCKTKLLNGRISPMVDFALSPLSNAELQQGYILACQAKVRTDLEVAVKLGDHPALPPRSVSAVVSSWRRLPGEVIDLRLQLDQAMPYEAGQYAVLAASGSFVRRSFSFYTPPPAPGGEGARELGFLVRRLPGGRFSDWLYAGDRTGTKIWVEGPFGVMGVDDPDRDALCVAGGTGLAPILSIVADRLQRSDRARFTIVFGVRTAEDRFAETLLAELMAQAPGRIRLITVLSHEPTDSAWQGPRGLVTAPLDARLDFDFREGVAFICGSLPMVEAVEQRLLALGMPAERLHADKFIPSGF